MYKIMLDGSLFWDPRVEELRIIDPVLDLETNKAGSLMFSVTPGHPRYNDLRKLKSIIEVYQDADLLFRGRPLDDEKDLWNVKSVICEGELAFFNDSIVRPYSHNGTITDFLAMVLAAHNAQVDASKRFTLGNVTVTDPNNYIIRSSINPVKSWTEISAKLLDLLGGFLMVRRIDGVSYLDYLADSPYISGQAVELTKNIIDIAQSTKSTEMITALIPYGAKLTNAEGQETEERLTIAAENGGIDYVYDAAAVAQYGWIFGTKTWDDVTNGVNLMTKANQELALRIALGVSVTVKAVDLSVVNPGVDKIRHFDYVQVTSAPHGIDSLALVTKQSLALMTPENNTLTFGFDYKTMTDKQVLSDKVLRTIEADYVVNEQVTAIKDSVTQLYSAINQSAENITLEVSKAYTSKDDFESYQEELSTKFTQDAETFDFKFTEIVKSVETVDGQQVEKFSEIEKHITFESGDIVLKATNSDPTVNTRISLRIARDRISFLDSGAEVAYISDNKLYILDGHFLNVLRVGNFSFRPRTNGSLSFGRVT